MGFNEDIQRFLGLADRRRQFVAAESKRLARDSIVEGSPITAAPGQPVGSGELRDSWEMIEESPTSTLIVSDAGHARVVEDNLDGAHYDNHGPHSVKITATGWPRIVAEANRRAQEQVR